MSDKKKKEVSTMSFRMEKKTSDRLRAYADKLGQNYTVCLERIINGYLDEKDKETNGSLSETGVKR